MTDRLVRQQAEQRVQQMNQSRSQQQQPYPHTQPQQQHYASTSVQSLTSLSTTSNPTFNTSQMARQEWRQHGTGVTQALEETARRHAEQGGWAARVVAATPRVDLTGHEYTAYIVSVTTTTSGDHGSTTSTIEHRYSDFERLHQHVQQARIETPGVVFPGKHWAGRVGPWTPSGLWAPKQHDQLIEYRLQQLDAWLVQLVEQWHAQRLSSDVRTRLHNFLTQPTPRPCQVETTFQNDPWWKTYNPVSFTMGSAIRQACWMVQHMCRLVPDEIGQQQQVSLSSSTVATTTPELSPDQSIPMDLLQAAQGIMFLTVAKAGLVVSGRVGTGLILQRRRRDANNTGNGNTSKANWSAPIAIGTLGMGWGALAGGEVTHYIVVLTSEKAVLDLVQNRNSVQLGAELAIAVGPVGRGANSHVQTGDWTLHPAYAYAHSKGLFVGMSLEGSFLSVRHDVNTKFYGTQECLGTEWLLKQPGCQAAEPLYQMLDRALQLELHRHCFRPSQVLFSQTPQSSNGTPSLPPVYINAAYRQHREPQEQISEQQSQQHRADPNEILFASSSQYAPSYNSSTMVQTPSYGTPVSSNSNTGGREARSYI